LQVKALRAAAPASTDRPAFAVIEPRPIRCNCSSTQGVQNTAGGRAACTPRHGLFGVDDRRPFYGVDSQGNITGNVAYNIP